mmetsp:Transcript_164702/g.291601  ORF Transcript_164702/g.291601 Transcript_164702/m.291601 type:complete len:321 (+) Transcript_164702:73-1035(+)
MNTTTAGTTPAKVLATGSTRAASAAPQYPSAQTLQTDTRNQVVTKKAKVLTSSTSTSPYVGKQSSYKLVTSADATSSVAPVIYSGGASSSTEQPGQKQKSSKMRVARSIDVYRLPQASALPPQGANSVGSSVTVPPRLQSLRKAKRSKTPEGPNVVWGASNIEVGDTASESNTEPPLTPREVDSTVDTNTDAGSTRGAKAKYLPPQAALLQNYRFRALPGAKTIPTLQLVPRDAESDTASEANTEPPNSVRDLEAVSELAARTVAKKTVTKSVQTEAALVLSERDLNDRMLEAVFERINWDFVAERREDTRSWCCVRRCC